MRTLVIYDELGYLLSMSSSTPEQREPIGVPYLWVDVPEGKKVTVTDGLVVDVSVTPHQVILEDIPKTETELIREQLKATQEAVDFLLLNGGL